MKTLTKTGAFWLSCLYSILVFMGVFWSGGINFRIAYWVESLAFFLLTYICVDEYVKRIPGLNPWLIGFAVILGQLIIHVPMRIYDFYGSMVSFMVFISCIIAIVLAVFCYKDKRPYTFILSYVVLTLFNVFVGNMWQDYVLSCHH